METSPIIDLPLDLACRAALKPGDHLCVKILEVFENNRALVDLGRFRALADISFAVAAGDQLRVRVQQTEGQLRLHLLPDSCAPAVPAGRAAACVPAAAAASLQAVQTSIGQMTGALQQLPAEFRPVLDALGLFLRPLDPSSSPVALARRLEEFCNGCGLFLEHRLAAVALRTEANAGATPGSAEKPADATRILSSDLKSRLLFLRAFFDSAAGRQWLRASREARGLAAASADLLADIRAGQEQMARAAAAPQAFPAVLFALPLSDERGPAQLKIAYGRRPAAGQTKDYRAAILLELDRLGAVRADLMLRSARLDVSVFVATAEWRDLVHSRAREIHSILAPLFEHVTFAVSVSPRKIARFADEDWPPAGEAQVDVRV